MRSLFIKAVMVVLLLSLSGYATATDYQATLIEVKDGDTVRLSVNVWPGLYQAVSVRLNGVDTPEKGWRAKCLQENEKSKAATAYTKEFMQRGKILLSNVKLGKYAGRVLGNITVNGQDLGSGLIAAGHGRKYSGGKRGSWCD